MQPIENQQYTQRTESGLAAAISLLDVCMQALENSTVVHNITVSCCVFVSTHIDINQLIVVLFCLEIVGFCFC